MDWVGDPRNNLTSVADSLDQNGKLLLQLFSTHADNHRTATPLICLIYAKVMFAPSGNVFWVECRDERDQIGR